MAFRVSQDEFDRLVGDVISRFPKWLLDQIVAANIDIVIEPELTADKRADLDLSPFEDLLGLYEGVPLDQRSGYGETVPDKITLFQREIESSVETRDGLIEQIETTLKHEIHHGFGADEDRVHDIGLG